MTLAQWVDKGIEIIKLLKPSFYNKITWTIVISGLALIGTPYIQQIINAIFDQKLNIRLTENNDSTIGYLLVLTGLIYNLITVYFEKYLFIVKREEQPKSPKQWDIKLFKRFLKEFPSGDTTEFLRHHHFANSFHLDTLDPVIDFVECWDNAESKFIDEDIEARRKELWEKANDFVNESIKNTFPRGHLHTVIPDKYNADFDLPQFLKDEIVSLNSLATQVYEAHQKFIEEAKKKLDS